MLHSISIKNFAIIEDLDITFSNNMTILTGETGAGKSIIIDALSLLIGERSDFDKIRVGAQKAIIEGEFSVKNTSFLLELSEKYGEDILDGNNLIVTRTLDINGRSVIRVNGVLLPLAKLKSIMANLIDIHSQHQNLYILDEKNHLTLLDSFIGENEEYKEFLIVYNEYKNAKKELKNLENFTLSESDALIIQDQIKELESADIKIGEIEELESEKERLMSSRRILDAINNFIRLCDDDEGALTKLFLAKKELERSHDEKLEEYAEKVENIYYTLKDINSSLQDELDSLANASYRLEEIDERLYFLKRLIKKYRSDEQEMLSLLEELKDKLYKIDHYQRLYNDQEYLVSSLYNVLLKKAEILSNKRKESALLLSSNIEKELHDLSLEYGKFEVKFTKSNEITSRGNDEVVFLLSTNKGVPVSNLKSVASGGETSRIMLALKTIFGRLSNMETIIFDEIDTGISGKVAMQVARKMKEIASYCQVLTISHLPQVAAIADHHYLLIKDVYGDVTKSKIIKLIDENDKIQEIAKLLSGSSLTEASLEAAKELVKEAKK